MARPTGRYFASVIAKIRDAKKKENIVVDDGFKMQLRSQLMAKIALQVQPVRTSWMERLAPFKSYLAVVPALALVIVAVVGLSKLPIDFKSSTVVPTSNPSQQPEVPSTNTPSNIEQTSLTNSPNIEPGIKTFPGRYALPADYFNHPQNVEAPLPVSDQPQQASNELSASSAQPEQKTIAPVTAPAQTSVPVKQPEVQYFSYQPQNSAQVGEGNIQPAPVQTSAAPVLPSVSGSTPSGQTNDSGVSSVSGSTPSVEAEQIKTASNEAEVPEAAQTVPAMTAMKAVVQPKTATTFVYKPRTISSVTELKLNEIAALPAEDLEANVFYSGNFSNDEKTVLEKNVVPYLADGRTVESVNVYQKDAATIAIEINYADGKVAIYHYKVGENGTWKLVQYTSGSISK